MAKLALPLQGGGHITLLHGRGEAFASTKSGSLPHILDGERGERFTFVIAVIQQRRFLRRTHFQEVIPFGDGLPSLEGAKIGGDTSLVPFLDPIAGA